MCPAVRPFFAQAKRMLCCNTASSPHDRDERDHAPPPHSPPHFYSSPSKSLGRPILSVLHHHSEAVPSTIPLFCRQHPTYQSVGCAFGIITGFESPRAPCASLDPGSPPCPAPYCPLYGIPPRISIRLRLCFRAGPIKIHRFCSVVTKTHLLPPVQPSTVGPTARIAQLLAGKKK